MNMFFNIIGKFLKEIIIFGLIGIILFLTMCGDDNSNNNKKDIIDVDGKKYEVIKEIHDTVFVEKEVKVPTYIPKYVTKIETDTVFLPEDVDSLEIVKDYFAKYEVIDTLQLNYSTDTVPKLSLGYGVMRSVISQNKIQSRDITWKYKIPTIYDTKIVKELPRNKFFIGGGIGFSKSTILHNAELGIMLKNKSDMLYGINTGVTQLPNIDQVNGYIKGNIYWKIGRR